MFGKRRSLSLNRIRDRITIKEGNEEIELYVDSEINSLIHGIREAEKLIVGITGESEREERILAAKMFAVSMFGKEQTEKLFDFYHGDENCVITICGMYFGDKKHGLSKKIAKMQKKIR